MEKITTVGLDLAKQVMSVHAVDGDGRMVTRKLLRREQLLRWTATLPECIVAMEACGGAHYWARELRRQGHTVRHHCGGVRTGVSQEWEERRQ
jgi:transposase